MLLQDAGLTMTGHIGSSGAAPTISANTGGALGSTGSAALGSQHDSDGLIAFTPGGAGITSGKMCTVTYNAAYAAGPPPAVACGNGPCTTGEIFFVSNAGSLEVWTNIAPTTGATYYVWYHLGGQ